ncbi:MAG: hypothetical protein Q7R54_02800 [bacterium]|nr:hypothetical protein [bacterium]
MGNTVVMDSTATDECVFSLINFVIKKEFYGGKTLSDIETVARILGEEGFPGWNNRKLHWFTVPKDGKVGAPLQRIYRFRGTMMNMAPCGIFVVEVVFIEKPTKGWQFEKISVRHNREEERVITLNQIRP